VTLRRFAQFSLAIAVILASVVGGLAQVDRLNHPASATSPTPMIIEQNPTLTGCGVGSDAVSDPKYVDLTFPGTVNVSIDWGDSSQSSATFAGVVSHTYADTSAHTITITGTFSGFGNPQYSGEGHQCYSAVTQWGDTGVTSLIGAFQRWWGLRSIPADVPSSVTDLRYLFANRDFTAQMNAAIATWDTTNVTEMGYMFSNNNFAGDISNWDVSNVNMLKALFGSSGTSSNSLFNYSLASWNLQDNVDMSTGFACPPLWSTENWTASLVGWASDQTPAHNVQLDACGKQWYDSAQSSRDYLVNTLGWTITNDGGSVSSPPTSSTSSSSSSSTSTSTPSSSTTATTLPTTPFAGVLAPGTAKALLGGQIVDVPVTTNADGTLHLVIAGETFTVPAASFPSGTSFTLSGTGAFAGSAVTLQLFSTPQVIGSLPVSNTGTYSGSATIPTTTPAGVHTLQMVTLAADGTPVVVELGVNIEGSSALPITGAVLWPALIGIVLLGLGALAVLARRRFPDTI